MFNGICMSFFIYSIMMRFELILGYALMSDHMSVVYALILISWLIIWSSVSMSSKTWMKNSAFLGVTQCSMVQVCLHICVCGLDVNNEFLIGITKTD